MSDTRVPCFKEAPNPLPAGTSTDCALFLQPVGSIAQQFSIECDLFVTYVPAAKLAVGNCGTTSQLPPVAAAASEAALVASL